MSTSFQLYMRSGPTPGERFPLEKQEIWLGRDPSNDIVIADPEVSRRHARFLQRGGTYAIEDMGSTNGTLVNGEMITTLKMLSHGDVIELGEHTSLIFEVTQTEVDETVAVFRSTEGEDKSPERKPVSTEIPPSLSALGEEVSPTLVEISDSPSEPRLVRRRLPTWAWIIIILGGLMVVCGVITLFIIDALNLYCVLLPGITNFFFPGACP